MHEFETFVYLDTQKTGSTFISYVLTECANEKIVAFEKHRPVGDDYHPEKFHFITVREPRDQYISLYSHGCSGAGGLSRRLRKKGHGDFYDSTWRGFRRWLKFILDLDQAKLLDDTYGREKAIHDLIGFQTYRFLELAMKNPYETIKACRTKDDLRAAYKENNIAQYVIRNETLREDFERLVTGELRHAMNVDKALGLIHESDKLNTSDRVDAFEDNPKIGRETREILREREWFLKELFDY
ncbi:MAG: hypothetical protein JOZ72_07850 [Alphaproteobacteria bacterium]|nr:hypothetical protein [Alphaproteobacteria bacterium]